MTVVYVGDEVGALLQVARDVRRVENAAIPVLHQFLEDLEQFIAGREIYVGVLGNHRLTVLPVWELHMDKLPADSPRIATRRLKIDPDFQKRHEVTIGEAQGLSADLLDRKSVV